MFWAIFFANTCISFYPLKNFIRINLINSFQKKKKNGPVKLPPYKFDQSRFPVIVTI